MFEGMDHLTTINYCELAAVNDICDDIVINEDCIPNNLNIGIFVDAQFVLDMCVAAGYPEYEYYYHLLCNIFEKIETLKKRHFKIVLLKVKAHTGVLGNEIADVQAKLGASRAIDIYQISFDTMISCPIHSSYYMDIHIRISRFRSKSRYPDFGN